jgi:hypothetical protein
LLAVVAQHACRSGPRPPELLRASSDEAFWSLTVTPVGARIIVRPTVILTAVGLAAGAIVGRWTSRALAPMLYGSTAFDAPILLVVAAALAFMALIATVLPARRAVRVDRVNTRRPE